MLRVFLTILLLPCLAIGQQLPSPVWCLGYMAGLDFKAPAPAPFLSSVHTHAASAATQCDANGNVLFYANGLKIWDKDGNQMPGSINPVWSAYTSSWNLNSMIIPDGANTNRYFVFTTFPSRGEPPFGAYFSGQLTYSVVDMSLNGGKGDVVPGFNHILLDTNCGHYMTIAPGSSCNYWVIVQSYKSGQYDFRTYEVNILGVQSKAVVSQFTQVPSLFPNGSGHDVGNRAGNMIYSYTRNKVLVAYENADVVSYDLDPATGKVSNPTALTWAYPLVETVVSATIPAICLSPDEQLLYTSGYCTGVPGSGFTIRQYPLTMTGNTLKAGSPYMVFNPPDDTYLAVENGSGFAWEQSAMQLGPDKKIYHAFTMGQSFMGRINNPDVPGIGCNFVPNAVSLLPNTYTTSALPSPRFARKSVEQVGSSSYDTIACFQPSITLHAPAGFSSYEWQDGSRDNAFVATSSGQHFVISTDNTCHQRKDSFNIELVNFDLSVGDDIVTCYDTILRVTTDAPSGAQYTWSDGSNGSELAIAGPGMYSVTITHNGCSKQDNVTVENEILALDLPHDTAICTGEKLALDATIDGIVQYTWQNGIDNPIYIVEQGGVYTVDVRKGHCDISSTIDVQEEYCDHCLSGIPNIFTPNGDGLNDLFRPIIYPICPVREYRFSVYNRFGERVYHTTDTKGGWDGKYKGQHADVSTYFYQLQFKGPLDKLYSLKGDVILAR